MINPISITEARETYWDAIVIGTGMGGGAAGWRLARSGKKVLFVEKAPLVVPAPEAEIDTYVEDPEARLKRGRWPTQHRVEVDGTPRDMFMALGQGLGGSTAIYGAALERLDRRDYEPGKTLDDKGSSATPETWPVSYDEMAPYYSEMEKLFGVTGEPDPLDPDDARDLKAPPPLGARDAHFATSFAKRGLHPYRQHVAMTFKPGCIQCTGRLCLQDCKQTARNVFVEPALDAGAALLADAEALRFDASAQSVEGLIIETEGVEHRLKAANYMLAAGTLFSPAILLGSSNDFWPTGLANKHDMVGRCLMFHGDNRIAVWPLGQFDREGPKKSLCFKDFYIVDGKKYGTVQAMGVDAGPSELFEFMESTRQEMGVPKLPLMKLGFKAAAKIGAKLFGPAKVFTGILEDLPYTENRIVLDVSAPSGIRVVYRIHDELKERSRDFRRMMVHALKPHRTALIDRGVRLNLGHGTGTCRFGDDPKSSVTDRNNRAHGVENLYIVDASFLPTSGGINPSLTVGANALRVADHILSSR